MTYEALIAGLKPRLKEKNIEWNEQWLEGKYTFAFCTHPPTPSLRWADYEKWGIEYREEEDEMDLYILQGDGDPAYHFTNCPVGEVQADSSWKQMNDLIQECRVLPRRL